MDWGCSLCKRPCDQLLCRECNARLFSDFTLREEDGIYYGWHYEGLVSILMTAWKSGGNRNLSSVFVSALRRLLEALPAESSPHPGWMIIPIPCSRAGRRKRGFDQMADIAGLLEKADGNHFAAVHLLRRKCRPERFGGKNHDDTVDLFELRKVGKADTLSRLGWKAILVDDIVVTGTSCVQARTLVAAQLHELPECVCLAGN